LTAPQTIQPPTTAPAAPTVAPVPPTVAPAPPATTVGTQPAQPTTDCKVHDKTTQTFVTCPGSGKQPGKP
jgi:hypothetical protein